MEEEKQIITTTWKVELPTKSSTNLIATTRLSHQLGQIASPHYFLKKKVPSQLHLLLLSTTSHLYSFFLLGPQFLLKLHSPQVSLPLSFSTSEHPTTMGRSPCCEKEHTNKGAWTKEEDERLINYIKVNGEGCWRSLPKAAGKFPSFQTHAQEGRWETESCGLC